MTVDSEAIFALAELTESRPKALEELRGSMAAAWLDERMRDTLFVARGVGRPLWLGEGKKEVFFASTKGALEVVEHYLGLRLKKRELPEGILLSLGEGRRIGAERFTPDRAFEETPLPPVRAPDEGASCLTLLATIAAA
jgi:asparagine synthetase B (glutamine-hydrolysing)